jgi:flagella basal body P-ring formation protein FlgA
MSGNLNQTRLIRRLPKLCGGLLLGLLLSSAQAQSLASEQELLGAARRWVNQSVSAMPSPGGVPLRLTVTYGALDSRLRLGSCVRVEPYMPPGSRLWGKTRLGLRCLEGASKWNVFLPVQVKAVGRAWVVRKDVSAGVPLGEADVMPAEVDWAEEASSIVVEPAQWQGQVTVRALTTGQALRQSMLRPAQVFQAGAQVRVLAQGPGFQITSDGQALSAGIVGQLTKVRMDNGRVMSVTVLDGRTVRLEI